ncbi:hypothetical protein SDC9_156548 [bioreactor metagenome]|uniref:Uncharacterized protein n=1 Tax=bioreactor metagenome TaxID=1076179 RepID=A0A645F7D6_9ZZZZ
MELHLHPAVFVGVDFFARRACDHGRLRAGSVGLGGRALAAVRHALGHDGEADAVRRRAVDACALGAA